MILCACLSLGLTGLAVGQTAQRASRQPQKPEAQNHKSRQKAPVVPMQGNTEPVNLSNGSSNSAYGSTVPGRFSIADPTINLLNERARGNNIPISTSGIVGVPRHHYGFASGHIVLHTTTSTSSGTQTGSGGVGTGSSPGNMGSVGPGMGVNGKSPYAGAGMYGIDMPGLGEGTIMSQERNRQLQALKNKGKQ
jgi:hypothetical protein